MTTLTPDQRAELAVLVVEYELSRRELGGDGPLALFDLLTCCARHGITPAAFSEQDAIDLAPAIQASALVCILTREVHT